MHTHNQQLNAMLGHTHTTCTLTNKSGTETQNNYIYLNILQSLFYKLQEKGAHTAAKLICMTCAPVAAPSERCDPMVTFCDIL